VGSSATAEPAEPSASAATIVAAAVLLLFVSDIAHLLGLLFLPGRAEAVPGEGRVFLGSRRRDGTMTPLVYRLRASPRSDVPIERRSGIGRVVYRTPGPLSAGPSFFGD
jgi:hypothetical protein